jgi:hypothetical protein
MAIISCPNCDKNISSQSNLCPYCGFQRGEVAEEQLKELRRRKLRDRIYHMKMLSYAALLLLIVAFGWFLVASSNFHEVPPNGPYILFAVGAICYLVIRAYLYKFKVALRKLR